jgi:hypothetical protein
VLDENEVIEALALDLLKQGYGILKKSSTDHGDADLIVRESQSKVKLFISATGVARSKAGRSTLEEEYTESQLFHCVARSIQGALKTGDREHFNPGDRIALAFPNVPGYCKYLSVQKPVLDSLGITVFLVAEDKTVTTL